MIIPLLAIIGIVAGLCAPMLGTTSTELARRAVVLVGNALGVLLVLGGSLALRLLLGRTAG